MPAEQRAAQVQRFVGKIPEMLGLSVQIREGGESCIEALGEERSQNLFGKRLKRLGC